MADIIGIQINTEFLLNKQHLQEALDKLSKSQNFNIHVNFTEGLKQFEKQVDDVSKKLARKTVKNDSQFINTKVEKQAFEDITKRISDVRKNVDQLAKININTNKKGGIQSATLTYYNKELAQTVTETMKWSVAQKKVNGELTSIKTFGTTNFNYSDNIAKAEDNAKKRNEIAKKLVDNERISNAQAEKYYAEKENKRIATTTETQKRIEQLVTNSNDIISKKSTSMSDTAAQNYVKSWESALSKRDTLDEQHVKFGNDVSRLQKTEIENEQKITLEKERQLKETKDRLELEARAINRKYGKIGDTSNATSNVISGLNNVVVDPNLQTFVDNISGNEVKLKDFDTELRKVKATAQELGLKEGAQDSKSFGEEISRSARKFAE